MLIHRLVDGLFLNQIAPPVLFCLGAMCQDPLFVFSLLSLFAPEALLASSFASGFGCGGWLTFGMRRGREATHAYTAAMSKATLFGPSAIGAGNSSSATQRPSVVRLGTMPSLLRRLNLPSSKTSSHVLTPKHFGAHMRTMRKPKPSWQDLSLKRLAGRFGRFSWKSRRCFSSRQFKIFRNASPSILKELFRIPAPCFHFCAHGLFLNRTF